MSPLQSSLLAAALLAAGALEAGPLRTTLERPGVQWNAGDGGNPLVVNLAGGGSETFDTQAIIDSPALDGSPGGTGPDSHFGNPNAAFLNQNAGEAYAFINLYAGGAESRMTSMVFRETPGSTQGLETDNHTVIVQRIDPARQTGTPVPLPTTALLLLPGIAALAVARRRGPVSTQPRPSHQRTDVRRSRRDLHDPTQGSDPFTT